MEELMDLLVTDKSPSEVSDRIKDVLFAKSAEKIEAIRPTTSNSLFGSDDAVEEPETETEVDTQPESEEE